MSLANAPNPIDTLRDVVSRHWGYSSFRPLQEQAMRSVLDGRDSLVVLPTGGGKSLCYQAPAVVRGDTTVVVSPLISLMKDQVDSLLACGVPAVRLDSSLSSGERFAFEQDLRQGAARLLFVSPERLVLTDIYQLLRTINVRTFAIDEAHCISHWGHDFRPEYRQLSRLKEFFPDASIHAYTATATERVRHDIINQLRLKDANVLVGNFDRPNLTYRILPRRDMLTQVMEVIQRHRNEAGIIYCLSRRDVDGLTADLQGHRIKAMPYHAGLSAEQRRVTQDAFAAEQCDIVVATVAFGMGIDRSNVRFVMHTTMPKSVEHYQQETGRAGRDGLEAECVLLHSGGDVMKWKRILEMSASEPGVDPAFLPNSMQHLRDLDRYCQGSVCRHRALVKYFGQDYSADNCTACDLCLGDAEMVPEADIVAQKILSCVARVKERFGVMHVVSVLRGENTESVRRWQHNELSTYGLLRECSKAEVRDWIHQLIGQSVLSQEEMVLSSGNSVSVLRLNAASWEVMRKTRGVKLMRPVHRDTDELPRKSKADTVSWEGVDRELFEELRQLRRTLAEERGVQPYMIFSDASLREFAICRPTSLQGLRLLYGVGDKKLNEFGPTFLRAITDYCAAHKQSTDHSRPAPARPATAVKPTRVPREALEMFQQGAVIEDVMHVTARARSTVMDYLQQYVRTGQPASISMWVPDAIYQQVAAAARKVGTERLKPIFVELGERVSYDEIRLVVSHLEAVASREKK